MPPPQLPTLTEVVAAMFENMRTAAQMAAKCGVGTAERQRYLADKKHWTEYRNYYRAMLDEHPEWAGKLIGGGGFVSQAMSTPKPKPAREPGADDLEQLPF